MSNYMYITRKLPSWSKIQYVRTSARKNAVMDGESLGASPYFLHTIAQLGTNGAVDT